MRRTPVNRLELLPLARKDGCVLSDFFVDGTALSTMLGVDRVADPAFCGFDLDMAPDGANGFLEIEPPLNQFGTGRAVLYRRHCGCDYCGVISCVIKLGENVVRWTDIRYECDELTEYPGLCPIPELVFEEDAYMVCFTRFLASCETSAPDPSPIFPERKPARRWRAGLRSPRLVPETLTLWVAA